MSVKTDRPQVRTAQDLERKYNISAISEAVKQSSVGLTKVNNELAEFINTALDTIDNLQDQIDGQIVTFYGNAEPTLLNYPVNTWTEVEYAGHVGDMYYDRDSGKTYRFEYKDIGYTWVLTNNEDLNRVLSIASNAQSTADNKKRIFTSIPTTPYDSGDIWIKNVGTQSGEIYICQVSRDSAQSFDENDFIIATKYTDDTIAEATKSSLEVLSGKVTYEVTNNYSKTEIEKIIEGTGFKYVKTTDSTFASGKNYYYYIPLYQNDNSTPNDNGNTYVALISGTDYSIGDSISTWENTNGFEVFITEEIKVTKVQTASATYDEDGMHYKKDGSHAESTINQNGLEVDQLNTHSNPYLYAGYVEGDDSRFNKVVNGETLIDFKNKAIVYTKNLVTEGDTVIGTHSLYKDYTDTHIDGTSVNASGWFVI